MNVLFLFTILLLTLIHRLGAFQSCRSYSVRRSKFSHRVSFGRKGPDEIDALKIDPAELSEEQKERFALIDKLNKEADEFAKLSGLLPSYDEASEKEDVIIPVADTKWSGQSSVEISRVSTRNTFDLINRPFLAVGDLIAFLTFAAIGRFRHQEGIDLGAIIETSLPFLLPWLAISPFLGAYSREATSSQGVKVATGILPGWVLTLASAFLVRYYEKGYPPPTPFMIVSAAATFALLFGWRSLYIVAVGATTDDDQKKAGFFEVFKMVSTLIRRW